MWQSKKTNNGKIPGPIRSKRENLLELFGRNIKGVSLNKNDFIHGKIKIHKVNIVGGPRCIKNKSKKRKREEEEKKATEKGIKDAVNYSIS